MRLLLIVLQVIALGLIYIGCSVASGAFAFHSGGGPAAMAAAVFLLLQGVLLGTLLITVVLPFVIVLLSTLCCAVLAGYRFFRWVRWVGLAINIAAACYCLFVAGGDATKQTSAGLRIGFILFFLCNSVLFFAIPKQPDVRKSREIIARAHLLLPLCIVLPALPKLAQLLFNPMAAIMIIVVLLVYCVPFALNFHVTRAISLPEDAKKVILPVIVSLAVMGLGGLAAPILAIPAGISLLLFILFLEMLLLYPERYPQRAWHVYCAMLLGRLPDKPASTP